MFLTGKPPKQQKQMCPHFFLAGPSNVSSWMPDFSVQCEKQLPVHACMFKQHNQLCEAQRVLSSAGGSGAVEKGLELAPPLYPAPVSWLAPFIHYSANGACASNHGLGSTMPAGTTRGAALWQRPCCKQPAPIRHLGKSGSSISTVCSYGG